MHPASVCFNTLKRLFPAGGVTEAEYRIEKCFVLVCSLHHHFFPSPRGEPTEKVRRYRRLLHVVKSGVLVPPLLHLVEAIDRI